MAPAPLPPNPPYVGVRFEPVGWDDDVYGLIRDAGATWIRLGANWNFLETHPGHYDAGYLSLIQSTVAKAKAAGLHVLMPFLGTPPWAGATWSNPPARKSMYANALSHMVKTMPEVDAWEIWNEENLAFYWKGTAHDYVELLKAANLAVKAANPETLVVFGGTAHTDVGWVHDCYAAGMAGHFDVLATHPYPRIHTNTDVAQILGESSQIRDLQLQYHDGGTPIWFTELGWAREAVGSQGQADVLTAAFQYVSDHLPYVGGVFWFEAKNEDPNAPPTSWQGTLALIGPKMGLTPAYQALKRWAVGHPPT